MAEKFLLLGDEALALGALHLAMKPLHKLHWMPDFQVFMPILVLLQLKLRNIFRRILSLRSAACIVNGAPTKKPLWNRHSACRIPEKEHWSA